jgi:hypothetical protein
MRADKNSSQTNGLVLCLNFNSKSLALVRERKSRANHQDHVVTVNLLILGMILGTPIEESGSTNQESKHLANLPRRDEPSASQPWTICQARGLSIKGARTIYNWLRNIQRWAVSIHTIRLSVTVANMASYAISSSLILVIHDNMIIETNHIVLACLCRYF